MSDKPLGRPSKYNPERGERILSALNAGNTRKAASAYGGIDPTTFSRWMDWGEEGREPFDVFCAAVKKAEADAEVRMVATIIKASQETWQAAAWWLERRRTEDYGRTLRTDNVTIIKGDADAPVVVTEATSSKLAGRLKTLKATQGASLVVGEDVDKE